MWIDQDMRLALDSGTPEAHSRFDERLGNFMPQFIERLQEYRNFVLGATVHTKVLVGATDQLTRDLASEAQATLASNYKWIFKPLTERGRAEEHDLTLLDSTFNITHSALAGLRFILDELSIMVRTAENVQVIEILNFPFILWRVLRYQFLLQRAQCQAPGLDIEPLRVYQRLRQTLSNISQRKVMVANILNQED